MEFFNKFLKEVSVRYCRFLIENQTHYGAVEDRDGEPWIVDLARAPEEDLAFRLEHGRATSWSFDFEPMPLSAAELLAPVTPSKIVCVGRNYRDHVKEMGSELPAEPLLFFKPVSALLRPGGVVLMPAASSRVDFEGELALVIGRRVRNLKEEDWRGAVRGLTLANDVTARDLQKTDDQWARAKGFDTFCPVGPLVSDELDSEAGLRLETRVNNEVRQHLPTGRGLSLNRPVCNLDRSVESIQRYTGTEHARSALPQEVSCRRICSISCASTPWSSPTTV
jgi:2-keto-4-pentenoate hydratase/2-oxohepta-3-ene-1,7-dioic acid hydratase in catechol pathway